MGTTTPDLIKRIQEKLPGMSKGHKLIAKYISDHYEEAAYMTAAKMGENVGVSESTVVRFAIEMGYDGYPKLQKALQELIKNKLTAVQRLEVSSKRIDENNILKSVLQSDMEKIKATLEEIEKESFDNIVECILNARNIYIVGVRSSASIASFMSFYFNLILDNVRLVNTTSESEMFEQIFRAGKEDVVIGISIPRYSKMTAKALKYAKNNDAKVVAITDSKESPIAKHADYSLIARSDMASFVDSLVAPLSVINALIVAIGIRKKESISKSFETLEKIWDEYQVYEKYEYDEPFRKAEHK